MDTSMTPATLTVEWISESTGDLTTEGVDDGTLADLVELVTEAPWEEGPDACLSTVYTFRHAQTGQVLGVAHYTPSDNPQYPYLDINIFGMEPSRYSRLQTPDVSESSYIAKPVYSS